MVAQGDIIQINFNPVAGSEQAGYRPAIVVSNNYVISKTHIVSVCPITRNQEKSLLTVELDDRTKTQGVVFCAHHRSIDLRARPYKKVEKVPGDKLIEIVELLADMISLV